MSQFTDNLTCYTKAAYPILVVETHEESRALAEIVAWAGDKIDVITWDSGFGLGRCSPDGKSVSPVYSGPNASINGKDPMLALEKLPFDPDGKKTQIFVFKDLHPYFRPDMPTITRAIRNLIPKFKSSRSPLIILSPSVDVPNELAKDIQVVNFALPDRDSLMERLDFVIRNGEIAYNRKHTESTLVVERPEAVVDSIVSAATGLTYAEAENAFSFSLIRSNNRNGTLKLDDSFAQDVFQEKIQALRNGLLTYVKPEGGFATLGGMDNLKKWCVSREKGFHKAARELHLPFPRGVCLFGEKGTGKTTVAKAIASEFKAPLFKLDIGKLFGSKVGESEARTRELIRLLEGIGSAVVLLDEMDKVFSVNATSGAGDSGVSSRMFGLLLSWMAEKTCPTFIVGTLNRYDTLPPELLRKGRFDELFYVGLPTLTERREIFLVLMGKRYKCLDTVAVKELEKCVKLSSQFSGAEIEAAIVEALYKVLESGEKQMGKFLVASLEEITPQSKLTDTAAARIKALQTFRSASIEDKLDPSQERNLNLN